MNIIKRTILPHRRTGYNLKLDLPIDSAGNLKTTHITVNVDLKTGQPVEVFYSEGFKYGSYMNDLMQEGCIMISMLMQCGYTPDQIQQRLSSRETGEILSYDSGEQGSIDSAPSTALGAICAFLADDFKFNGYLS